MSSENAFDLCVVGGGSAGYAAAATARNAGKTVAIVDGPGPMGGLCILRGCMPSKTLLRSAEVAQAVREAAVAGVETAPPRIDFAHVMDRKRRIIKEFADDRVSGIESFPLFRGAAAFTSENEIRVDGQTVTASRFVIATGSTIAVPEIPGLAESGAINSDGVLELERLPASVIVAGGGPTACELAQYLSRLGVQTTIVQRSATLLSGEDPDVGACLRKAFEHEGIRVCTGTRITKVERSSRRTIVHYLHEGHSHTVEAEMLFVAMGRVPHVEGLGLERAGVDYSHKGVRVDAFLRTSNPKIFAAGDVVHDSKQLVHVAVFEGMLAARNAFSAAPRKTDRGLQFSRAVFTEPQVAVAGLTEREAAAAGRYHAVATYPFDDLGKAIATDRTQGFIKMLADKDGALLGVTIVGPEASDLIHEAIALLYFKANVRDIVDMPHLHPTLSEIMTYPAEELMERLENERRALVTP